MEQPERRHPALIYGVTVYNSGKAGHTAGSNLTELAELHAGTKGLAVDERIVSTTGTYGDSHSTEMWYGVLAVVSVEPAVVA
jgi:hypothetical protein